LRCSLLILATLTHVAAAEDRVEKTKSRDRGAVLGFEIGYGAPGGNSGDIYGAGFGTGFVLGYRYERFTLEWHFHHSHRSSAKQRPLRADATQGELELGAALVRVRLVAAPVLVEILGGPAMMSVPQLRIGEDDRGDPIVDTKGLRGVGVLAGGFIGRRVGRYFAIGAELRATIASKWEMPGDSFVVPGAPTADGGVMYTESAEDASGKPWSVTAVMRILL
jgi:hypothetical protein